MLPLGGTAHSAQGAAVKSRLLSRLDADIATAAQPLAADCLRCERAAYLARLGDSDQATRELAAVQQRHQGRPQAAISAWLSLADALVSHYRDMGPLARDKMKRAHAMSAAAGLQPLQALSAAWLAHLDYLCMDAPAMARHAAEALKLAGDDHHAARARANLVVAQSYHEGGRLDLARPWYDRAHRHATTEGDDATLSAMIWNMASLRVAAARQAEACGPAGAEGLGPAPAASGEYALLSTESTAHFDAMLGVRSLRALQPTLRAQICTLLGQTDTALALYEEHLAAALGQGMATVEGSLRADRAWCRLQAGHTQGARDDAAEAAASLASPGLFGDRAPGHSRLVQVYEMLGDAEAARRHAQFAVRAWEGHRADQARLVAALDREFAAAPL